MGGDKLIGAVLKGLGAINEPITVGARNLSGVFLVLMTGIVMIQVIARYGLNNSLSWSEELSKTLMVWSAFLVAPWAYRNSANVAIEMFSDAFPKAIARAAQLVITLLVLWITAVFFVESLAFVERGMKANAAALPVKTGVFYLVTPFSFAMLFVVGCELLCRQAQELIAPVKAPEA
ncbi:MAG: TRAP transporter small permease [Pseudomonadota bacterium]